MLKKTESPGPAPPDEERPIGELVEELVDEGKAYAKAELDLAKAVALAKANAFKLPAILFLAALMLLQTGVNVLGFGTFAVLLGPLGPMGAALVGFIVFAAIAGGLAWYGAKRLREDL